MHWGFCLKNLFYILAVHTICLFILLNPKGMTNNHNVMYMVNFCWVVEPNAIKNEINFCLFYVHLFTFVLLLYVFQFFIVLNKHVVYAIYFVFVLKWKKQIFAWTIFLMRFSVTKLLLIVLNLAEYWILWYIIL